jgi:hypothetical protein
MGLKLNPMSPDEFLLIKKKGIFDLDKLFTEMHAWYIDHKYELHIEDHKVRYPTPLGAEVEVKLWAWRNEDDFTRWEHNIQILYWDAMEVEAIIDGHKKILTKCRIKIKILVNFEFDYQEKWNTPLFKKMLDFYLDKIVRKKIDVEGDKFEYETFDLHELIKRDLEITNAGNQFAHFWK